MERRPVIQGIANDRLRQDRPHLGFHGAPAFGCPQPQSVMYLVWKVAAGKPAGWSIVDEFLAEKHLDAAWEDGRVSSEERLQWRARLERYEVQPAELETFVASRTPNP